MSESSTLIGYQGRATSREGLAFVPTPPATNTHRPVPHHEIVQALTRRGASGIWASSMTNTLCRRMG